MFTGKYFHKKKGLKGFTLIELLVVIFVIALLATIITIAVSKVRKKSRDVKRMADLRTLEKAVQLYMDDNGNPPATAGNQHSCLGFDDGTNYSDIDNANCLGDTNLKNELSPYLSGGRFPMDPKTEAPFYYYSKYSNAVGVDINVRLEDIDNNCKPPFIRWCCGGASGTSCDGPEDCGYNAERCSIRIPY